MRMLACCAIAVLAMPIQSVVAEEDSAAKIKRLEAAVQKRRLELANYKLKVRGLEKKLAQAQVGGPTAVAAASTVPGVEATWMLEVVQVGDDKAAQAEAAAEEAQRQQQIRTAKTEHAEITRPTFGALARAKARYDSMKRDNEIYDFDKKKEFSNSELGAARREITRLTTRARVLAGQIARLERAGGASPGFKETKVMVKDVSTGQIMTLVAKQALADVAEIMQPGKTYLVEGEHRKFRGADQIVAKTIKEPPAPEQP